MKTNTTSSETSTGEFGRSLIWEVAPENSMAGCGLVRVTAVEKMRPRLSLLESFERLKQASERRHRPRLFSSKSARLRFRAQIELLS